MQPNDESLIKIFDKTRQLVLPRFQRPYTWSPKVKNSKVKQFWEDIQDSYFNSTPHFTGTIVLVDSKMGTDSCPCDFVIDGQQRLVTTALMIKAFSMFMDDKAPEKIAIHGYLYNSIPSVYNEDLKILTAEKDRKPFKKIISGKGINKDTLATRVGQTFNYFVKEIKIFYDDPDYGPEFVMNLYRSVIKNIHVIVVNIDDGEDPCSVFHSLNGKNEPLSSHDLIRNYILMRLQSHRDPEYDYQRTFYENSWQPFEELFESDKTNIEEFFRYYLMLPGGKVSKNNLYTKMKDKLDSEANLCKENGKINQEKLLEKLTILVNDMTEYAMHYRKITGADNFDTHDKKLNQKLRRSIDNLNQIGSKTFRPYLLNILKLNDDDFIDNEELLKIVNTIESYFMRRSIFGGLKTNTIDSIFVKMCLENKFSFDELYDVLIKEETSKTYWPTDDLLQKQFEEIPYYNGAIGNDILRLVLHRIDEKLNNKPLEMSMDDSIEHIFPQEPKNSAWENCEDFEYLNSKLNYIGNLTISDHNQDHARKPYDEKRQNYLKKENHPMTRKIALDYETWNEESFEKRTQQLVDWVIELWPIDKNKL